MQHVHAEFGFDIGFVLSKNSSVTLPYTRDKGTLPWQPNFGENKPKNHNNGYNFSCIQHIYAEFGFEIRFVLSRNSSVTLPYTRDNGALPWQPNFGTNIAINAYKCICTRDSETVITYSRGFFVVEQSKEYISDCKRLMHVAMATSFWPK